MKYLARLVRLAFRDRHDIHVRFSDNFVRFDNELVETVSEFREFLKNIWQFVKCSVFLYLITVQSFSVTDVGGAILKRVFLRLDKGRFGNNGQ
jgi:hypothetical protein